MVSVERCAKKLNTRMFTKCSANIIFIQICICICWGIVRVIPYACATKLETIAMYMAAPAILMVLPRGTRKLLTSGVNPNFSEARILDGSTAIFEVVLKTMSSGSCIASRNCLGVILQIKNSIVA